MSRATLQFAVRLTAAAPAPLALERAGRVWVARLAARTLNLPTVRRWLRHAGVPCRAEERTGRPTVSPLLELGTVVLCCDPRLHALAALFARAIAAPLHEADSADAAAAAVEAGDDARSVTIFLLNDRLTEELCFAIAQANRRRGRARRPPRTYGFMTAFTPEQAAWLVVKTLLLLCSGTRKRALVLARFDAEDGQIRAYRRAPATGAMQARSIAVPWSAPEVDFLGIHAHGVSFDAQLGRVALCGHLDPPLDSSRLAQAPACFHDGSCFRIVRRQGAESRLPAVEASPRVWFLNSCAAVPFAGNAFGDGTSYAMGLLAGAAAGVIGPYLTLPTSSWLNSVCEGLLATGATLGEVAAGLCQAQDAEAEFDPFVLLGSPDLRLAAAEAASGEPESSTFRYRLRGAGRLALRLRLPPGSDPLAVVDDDGGEAWDGAGCQLIERGPERDLLVMLRQPSDLDGWLRLGPPGRPVSELRSEIEEVARRLAVLANYSFAAQEGPTIDACKDAAERFLACLAAPQLLRGHLFAALLLSRLYLLLDQLQPAVAQGFLDRVIASDFSFDRESHNGFEAGALRRSERSCPGCGGVLYTALDRWLGDRNYRRRKDVCANCIGVSMALESSPLAVDAPRVVAAEGGAVGLRIGLRNPSRALARAWIAAAPRHGPAAAAVGPLRLDLPAGGCEERLFSFPLDVQRPGVLSFRFAVFCQGAVEFHSCKYANTASGV